MLNWFTGNYSLLVSYIIKESAASITAQNKVNLDFRWINYRVPYNYPISIFYRYYYLFLLELVILPFRCSRICCKDTNETVVKDSSNFLSSSGFSYQHPP